MKRIYMAIVLIFSLTLTNVPQSANAHGTHTYQVCGYYTCHSHPSHDPEAVLLASLIVLGVVLAVVGVVVLVQSQQDEQERPSAFNPMPDSTFIRAEDNGIRFGLNF